MLRIFGFEFIAIAEAASLSKRWSVRDFGLDKNLCNVLIVLRLDMTNELVLPHVKTFQGGVVHVSTTPAEPKLVRLDGLLVSFPLPYPLKFSATAKGALENS